MAEKPLEYYEKIMEKYYRDKYKKYIIDEKLPKEVQILIDNMKDAKIAKTSFNRLKKKNLIKDI